MPKDSASQEVQCAKCGANNPRDATACQSCGAALLATAQTHRRVPLVPRLLVSLLLGIIVFATSILAAFQQYPQSAIRYAPEKTLQDIERVGDSIEDYRQEKGALPARLEDLPPGDLQWPVRTDETGGPLDAWRRPLNYWTDGTEYRITSYGREGKPGGLGLDYDLSSDDLQKVEAWEGSPRWLWSKMPQQARPTFRQFISDRNDRLPGAYGSRGTGGRVLATSVLTGAVTFLIVFGIIGRRAPVRRSVWALVLRLIVTVAATLFIGTMIASLHLPTGH